jgi:hypothetical protein
MGRAPETAVEDAGAPRDIVRAALARADRLRRVNENAHRLWTIAPWAAAVCAAIAVLARLAGWFADVALVLVVLAAAALAVYAWFARRDRVVTDDAAAVLDTRAALRGELRSAYWFAAQDSGDPWIEFHLSRAADRVRAVDWPAIFPAPQAGRAKTATALLVVLVTTLTLQLGSPAGATVSTRLGDGDASSERATALPLLPPELLAQIAAMLSKAEASGGKSLTASEVRDLLAKLDQLRAGTDDQPRNAGAASARPEDKAQLSSLADRARRDAENLQLEPQAKDALSDLASRLDDEMKDSQVASKDDLHRENEPSESHQADATKASASGDSKDGSMQTVREASAAAANMGVVKMSAGGEGAQSKEAGLGLGGSAGDDARGGRMPDLAAALRRETVEAQKDTLGENVQTDTNRKTEQGDASLAFTRAQAGAAERGRSTAPPAVPDSRRAAVRSYFTRKQ